MALHRLIDVHSCQGRHIKSGKPHLNHDNDFKRAAIIFELLRQFFLVMLVADDLPPLFRIFVGFRHNNGHFFAPTGTQFQNPLIDLHCNISRVSNDHRLTGQQIFSVIFVVIQNIAY